MNLSALQPNVVALSTKGHIEALDNMKLTVTFLPGVPERFQKTFQVCSICTGVPFKPFCGTLQVQVAHLQADEITLVGEGVFPRIGFDLPSQLLDPGYSDHSQLRESALGTTNTVSDDVRKTGHVHTRTSIVSRVFLLFSLYCWRWRDC